MYPRVVLAGPLLRGKEGTAGSNSFPVEKHELTILLTYSHVKNIIRTPG